MSYSDPQAYQQANLPRFAGTTLMTFLQQQINAQTAPLSGSNFRVSGGVLQLKNVDTALYNTIDSFGADGAAGVQAESPGIA